MKSAVFIERDGLLNKIQSGPKGPVTPRTLGEFSVNEGAIEPLRRLHIAGFTLIVTTHQPGLIQGDLSRTVLDGMHRVLYRAFPGLINDMFVCPHTESSGCPCRRPRPGLIIESAFKWHVDPRRSFLVSNHPDDAQVAHFAGCASVLVRSPWLGDVRGDYLVDDLPAAVSTIIEKSAVS